jgi:hypothetical protein
VPWISIRLALRRSYFRLVVTTANDAPAIASWLKIWLPLSRKSCHENGAMSRGTTITLPGGRLSPPLGSHDVSYRLAEPSGRMT